MAKLLSWQGHLPEAAAIYQDLLARHPLDDEYRVGLARVLSWQQKYADARKEYEQVLLTDPQHLDALRGLADVLSWSGRPDEAIPYYERVVTATADPDVMARLEALKSELNRAGHSSKDPSHDRTSAGQERTGVSTEAHALDRGRRLEVMRQYVEAVSVYREGLAQFPENDDLRSALAQLLSWQGAHVEATQLYGAVLFRHPEDQDVRIALAQVLSWQKQFNEAHRLYDQVLEADQKRIEARRGLAELAHWQGHREEALTRYEALLAETHDPEIAEQLNAVRSDLAASQKAPVPQTLPGASTADTTSQVTASELKRAKVLEAAKQYPEAEALYRTLLRQDPENDEIRAAFARVLSWQGRHVEAITLYRELWSRHPEDQDIRIALAQVLSWQKQFPEAKALYEEVVRAEPGNVEARRGLAEVAHWQGNRTEALQRYETLAAETQDPDIMKQLNDVRSELLVSPRARVGQGLTGLRLPYRDYAKIGYGHYSYTKNQPDERDLLFEIAKPIGDQTLVLRVEPTNRFGFHDTPLSAELYSPLWQRAWGYVAAQGTVNPNFAPNYSVIGEVAQGLGGLHASLAPFELSFGYRRLNYRKDDIDLLMPGLTIFLPFNVWLTEKIYLIPNTGAVTLSSQLTWRPTDRFQLFASGSFGTSGERIVAEQDFTRVGSRTIQGGVTFPITDRFSAEVSGYYEDRGFLYVRRGGNFNLIYHW